MKNVKWFANYEEAYQLYSDIVSGRDNDRKNASIIYSPDHKYNLEVGYIIMPFGVIWEKQ